MSQPQRPARILFVLCMGWAVGFAVELAVPQALSGPQPPMEAPPEAAPLPVPVIPARQPPAFGTPCPVDPPPPTVTIRVRVAACALAGQELEYRICVENRSQAAAHHVTIRNPLPANAEYVRAVPVPSAVGPELVWRRGTLPPGACEEIVLVLRPTGAGDVNNCARVQFEHGQCVTTTIVRPGPDVQPPPVGPPLPAGRPALSVRKTGPERAVLYDPVTFRVEVSNPGAAPLADVVLTDILPKELRYEGGNPEPNRRELLTWELGTLAPGQRRVIEYRALALKEGTFNNRAVVTAAGGLREESASQVTVGKPELELVVIGPEKRYVNRPALYELTVSNPGNAPASNVVLASPVPEGVRFSSASDGGMLAGNEVRWALGTLAAGARRTVRLQLHAQKAAEAVIRATATAERDVSASAEAKTAFEGVTGLTARVSDVDPVAVGQEVAYVVTVRNTGTADATGLKVTTTVPEQMQPADARGPSKASLAGNVVTFEPVTLKPNEEVRYEIFVKALRPGDVRFRAAIEANELTAGPLREEESTTIFRE